MENSSQTLAEPPLALQERDKWAFLLRAFEESAYRSKAEQFLPSFTRVLQSVNGPPGRALDAGCGSGLLGKVLLDHGWEVEGIDILPEAVEMASRRFPTRLGDIGDPPWPSSSFDLVLCSMVLMLVEDVDLAIHEMARVLRPGGTMLVAILNPCYEGPERVARCDHFLGAPRESWLFRLGGGITSVDYYLRSLGDYRQTIALALENSTFSETSPTGTIIRLSQSDTPSPKAEYVWFTGTKMNNPCLPRN